MTQNKTKAPLIPLYTTHGNLGGYLIYPYLYSAAGEWIGWVTADRMVFSVHGHFAGALSPEMRIVRKREIGDSKPRRTPPPAPPSIRPPARMPLPPQMPELGVNMIDVLDEAPELLPVVDAGDLRDDLD
jgi:hypothetical protein